jgi:hypothetical protein
MFLGVWNVTFTVSDLEQAADLDGRVLGLPLKFQFPGYAGFDCGGVEIGLVPGRVAEDQTGVLLVDLFVQNVEEAHRGLAGKNVRFETGGNIGGRPRCCATGHRR